MMQRPPGPKDMTCPLHRKAMVKVCQTCPWWVLVRGTHPQTGAEVDEWNCAIAWGPVLAINTAQQARSGAAATESLRNTMVRGEHVAASLQATMAALVEAPPRQTLRIADDHRQD